MTDSTARETLNDRVRALQQVLETAFLFRKLGLCFDYASNPQDFPRSTLPTSKETKDAKPNDTGAGTGIAQCARNDALLFDGYLLRLELGFADPDEERIFDRLIGGLIRIATVASKGFLARGLAPDGRGYYRRTDLDSHLYWAFSAWRGYRTAAIATDSQEKIANIASKWINRLKRDDWQLKPVDGKGGDNLALSADDPAVGPVFLALLAIASDLTGHGELNELYTSTAEENGRARLTASIANANATSTELLRVQLAYSILAAVDTDENRQALIRARMGDIADAAVPLLEKGALFKDAILEEEPDLNWRSLNAEEAAALGGPDGDAAHGLPVSWRRITHESDTIRTAMEAALALLLAGEAERCRPHADTIARMLASVPWERLWLAAAVAPMISIHARGVELGLWDETLLSPTEGFNDGKLLDVTAYLKPEYDEHHATAAGHTEAPRKKPQTDNASDDGSGNENKKSEGKAKTRKGRGGRRRRRRKRR